MAEEVNYPDKDGYEDPYLYKRPIGKIIGILLLLLIPTILLVYEHIELLMSDNLLVSLAMIGASILILDIPNVQLHERVHFYLKKLLGYEPKMEIAWHLTAGRVYAPGQFVDANHNIISLLAPLITLDLLYLILVLSDLHPLISFGASLLFLTNTLGSSNDIYGAYFDYRLPKGSLVYVLDDTENPMPIIYEPRRN